MARITGLRGGLSTRLAIWFTRRHFARLTGRAPERAVEPLELFAHLPGLLRGYSRLEQAVARLHGLDRRTDALAELRAATVVRCEFCIDLASQVARQWGLTDAELLALPEYRTSELFDERDRLVLDYATAMSREPVRVTDELVAALRVHFSEAQLVQLTFVIALENLRGRFNAALGVEAAGFSEGREMGSPR
ncbi:MAG TPA: carboxymuconolactone decarboxylase family protein [Pseudonocardiaceae bacterium]|nr:carboxymuconolactone decarboxylase family protein [Pseudonocardiaceae bacterium]